MATEQPTVQNGTETEKAAKRRFLLEMEGELQKIREHRREVAAKWTTGTDHQLELRSRNSSVAVRLFSPDFMSTATYLKLYLQECDELIAKREKELDEFVY